MPTFTVNAEIATQADGMGVHIFVDGIRHSKLGPYSDWQLALSAAQRVIDEVRREVLPTLNATTTDDLK
jgi:hypothetical protein